MEILPPTDVAEESVDRLAGDWWIHQLVRGHRYNTDDLLVAWTALKALTGARRILDLGSGTGSIGLLCLLILGEDARLTGIEVQERSVALARKTAATNGIANRVRFIHADYRVTHLLTGEAEFDLITGNPPYLPPGRALASPYAHRANARLELHGDVFDLCRAAARHLSPEGCFCFCHAADDPRPEEAIEGAGLQMLGRREVVFRAGQAPRLALFTCGFSGGPSPQNDLLLRDEDGGRTEAFRAVRRFLLIEA